MKFSAFEQTVAAGKISPAYLFIGEEEFLSDRAVKQVVAKLLTPEEQTLNMSVRYGGEVDDLLDDLFNPPMFARYRVTVIQDAEQLSEKPLRAVERYLAHPPRDACLMMVCQSADQRRKFFKVVSSRVEAVECKPLTTRELGAWAERYAGEQGRKLDGEVVARMTIAARSGLRDLVNEIDRLILLSGDEKRISLETYEELGSASAEMARWRLSDAVGSGDLARALEVVSNLEHWGTKPTQLIGDLARLFRSLWLIKWYIINRKPEKISLEVKLHPFVLSKYTDYARRISMESIEYCLMQTLEAELHIKRGLREGSLELALLVGELTRSVRAKP